MNAEVFQVMPPLSATECEALKADIAENGVLVPVVKDQHGRIIDGHHRSRIADELGVSYRVDIVRVDDDQAALRLARVYNMTRRHLTREQRRQLIADEIKADPTRSNRAIGRLLGVDHKTVATVREWVDGGEIPHPPKVKTHNVRVDLLPESHPVRQWYVDTGAWLMKAETYRGLKDSIRRFGVINPVVVDADTGTVVDGYYRMKAAAELGVECPTRVVEFTSDAEIHSWIFSLNLMRQDYTPEELAAIDADIASAEATGGDQ